MFGSAFGSFSFTPVFFGVLGLMFTFWPFVLLIPLEKPKSKHLFFNLILIWGLLAMARVALLFDTNPTPILPTSFLIKEPLNTWLFVGAGAFLIGIQWLARNRSRAIIQKVANTAYEKNDLLELSPREFEDLVVELYTRMGHNAKRTGAIGDHGVDVEVQAANGEKWIVQCKRWRGSVGEPIIRDFYGVMHHEKADKGAIVTTGKFTPQAREWAKGKPLTLLEGDEFLAYLKKVRR